MISVSFVIGDFFSIILEEALDLVLPFVNVVYFVLQLYYMIRLELQFLRFDEQVAHLLLLVGCRTGWCAGTWGSSLLIGAASTALLLAFTSSHPCFPDDDGLLDSVVQVLSLSFPLFDLRHQLLKVDRNVFAIDIDLINSFKLHELQVSDALNSLLPLFGFLELLLQNNHLLSYIAE